MAIHHNNDEFKHKDVFKVILLAVEVRPDSQLYTKVSVRKPFFRYKYLFKSPTIADYLRNGYVVCLKM